MVSFRSSKQSANGMCLAVIMLANPVIAAASPTQTATEDIDWFTLGMGLGLVFLGMGIMSEAMTPLRY
jgi:Na+/phosphate symporter